MPARSIVLLATVVAFTVSCERVESSTDPVLPPVPPALGVNGTVRFLELEGGCWVIDVAGRNHEPTNLPPAYRVDGQPVRVVFHEAKDVGSFCMVGPIITLDAIQTR